MCFNITVALASPLGLLFIVRGCMGCDFVLGFDHAGILTAQLGDDSRHGRVLKGQNG